MRRSRDLPNERNETFDDTIFDFGFVEVNGKSDRFERCENRAVVIMGRDEQSGAAFARDLLDGVDQFAERRLIRDDIVQMNRAFFEDPRERATRRDQNSAVGLLQTRAERFFFDVRTG